MQSSNPIAPARQGSFALALAVTLASLIMGGEVALAEPQCSTQGPGGGECTAGAYHPSTVPGVTINIRNQFSQSAQLYGSNHPDSDFWIYCDAEGTGKPESTKWYYTDTCGAHWTFGTGCFIHLSEIMSAPEGGRNIYLDGGTTAAAKSAVIQAIYWPQNSAPSHPPLTSPPQGTAAPVFQTGNYAAYVMLEMTLDAAKSNVDVTVLDRYDFAHQLLYWNNPSCTAPTTVQQDKPNVATGFNGILSSDQIYTALTSALGTQPTNGGYYPANYPQDPLMMLNGAQPVTNWNNYVYNQQTQQWTSCSVGAPLTWGLPTTYLTDSNYINGVSTENKLAQNYPIDTGGTAYSSHFGLWHPSKSCVTKVSGVNVAQTFGNRYGGDSAYLHESGYLEALYANMPAGGYRMSRNDEALNLDPGDPASGYKNVYGCNGYSFNLNIVRTNYGDEEAPLYDYHIELTDISVFTAPHCGPGFGGDPPFTGGAGVWYPDPDTCGTAQDYSMMNASRGRVGVPTDPLMCLLLEGQCPAPYPSLSDKYDYPYVYDQVVLVPPSPDAESYGPAGGPVLTPGTDPHRALLTDEYNSHTNKNGTGRTISPPGLSAFRRYLAEDGVYEAVAGVNKSDMPSGQKWVYGSARCNVNTIVYTFASTVPAAPGGNPVFVPGCPIPGGSIPQTSFCVGYNGNYYPNGTLPTWDGHPSFGSGLKSWIDDHSSTGVAGLPSGFDLSPGSPFTWAGPFFQPLTSSISVNYYVCTDPNGCYITHNGPGDATDGPANGWVPLSDYPKPLHSSTYWSWPPTQKPSLPTTSAGVQLKGTFNWDGSQSSETLPANIKIGTNGYPEAYFASPPAMKWKAPYSGGGYNASQINWNNQWVGGQPWFYPEFACSSPTLPVNGLPLEQGTFFGGGAIVPNLGNWTDYFLNLGGAPSVCLTMYSSNTLYPSSGCSNGSCGPCPNVLPAPGSQGLYGFDPFIKVTNWPMAGDPVAAALEGSGVTDATLEGWFSQNIIASMLGDVSTAIQFGLLKQGWNDGLGLEYWFNAIGGSPNVPFDSSSVFQKPSLSYTGTVGNAFVETLLDNSLGYNGQNGGFPGGPNGTKVIPPYVSSFTDRFKNVSPDFAISPGNSYLQWRLGVPASSSVSDIDGDGCVGSNDLTMLLAAWGACGKGNCPEDLNKDGIVEGGDLVHVLAEWGVGCGSP